MWRFYLLDAFLYLGVLFYRYCPIPRFRLVPLLVISGLVAAYLKREIAVLIAMRLTAVYSSCVGISPVVCLSCISPSVTSLFVMTNGRYRRACPLMFTL